MHSFGFEIADLNGDPSDPPLGGSGGVPETRKICKIRGYLIILQFGTVFSRFWHSFFRDFDQFSLFSHTKAYPYPYTAYPYTPYRTYMFFFTKIKRIRSMLSVSLGCVCNMLKPRFLAGGSGGSSRGGPRGGRARGPPGAPGGPRRALGAP